MYSGVVKRAAAPLVLLALIAAARPAGAQEAIYVVRHAERADQSADSPLSTEGIGRSYRLRDLAWLIVLAPLEIVVYRPPLFWAHRRGAIEFFRGQKHWERFERNDRGAAQAPGAGPIA